MRGLSNKQKEIIILKTIGGETHDLVGQLRPPQREIVRLLNFSAYMFCRRRNFFLKNQNQLMAINVYSSDTFFAIHDVWALVLVLTGTYKAVTSSLYAKCAESRQWKGSKSANGKKSLILDFKGNSNGSIS